MFASGRRSLNLSTTSLLSVLGKSTWNAMYKFPLTNGLPRLGIPSPDTSIMYGMDRPESGSFVSPRMTSPGLVLTIISLPSRWLKRSENPVRAWFRLISCMISKSAPFLLNRSCSFSCMIKLTSPVSLPGISSAIPRKLIFWLLTAPFSTCTSMTFRSFLVFAMYPFPPQVEHGRCICVIIPGPICLISMTNPCPLQAEHSLESPTMTLRLMANFTVFPLYKSFRLTFSGC
mmetsp:Transcript_4805/g.13882  ORF Transcript_4805/g.13882 Transcript_4805/m.13882 type:complete len:231 (+) Transcript_4805:1066-1758(+)